jgi:hypothetical protein
MSLSPSGEVRLARELVMDVNAQIIVAIGLALALVLLALDRPLRTVLGRDGPRKRVRTPATGTRLPVGRSDRRLLAICVAIASAIATAIGKMV